MAREPKPDFERYMTALNCREPDRVPLGEWHVDAMPMESFLGRKIKTMQDKIEFWYSAGFDYVTTSSGILEPVRAPEGLTIKGDSVHTEYEEERQREWAIEGEGIITDWKPFEAFPWPSADDFDFSNWDELDQTLPNGMKGVLLLGKIYTCVWMFMGAETFFNALEEDEELVGALFEKVGRIQYETLVYERIRTIGPGGGYMVASSNSITDYVPLANMKAMIEATLEFGQYPIRLEAGRVEGKVWKYAGKAIKKNVATSPTELDVSAYLAALMINDPAPAVDLFQKDLTDGQTAHEIVNKGLIPAMTLFGDKFQKGEIYIPEMIIAAKTMSATLGHFKDHLTAKGSEKLGSVVIGTVKGDLHDIGKNLVAMMLEGQGFEVEDLGISVSPERFVEIAREKKPNIIALSALLTTTMIEMKNVIDTLKEAGLRETVSVIVGGAPVTQNFADEIGADGYAYDSPGAAQLCKELV